MAETLGSLCDKLTIIKLKEWHSEDLQRLKSLALQEKQIQEEIDGYILDAVSGRIAPDRLTFSSNKVYKKEGNAVGDIKGSLGGIFSQLAEVNCKLWHVQENVYDFEKIPGPEKDRVVRQLALLNLERNKCIDQLDLNFQKIVSQK
ncbi:MAG: hypothetical protein HY200_01235 [Nitrospirae bacterium]|nr:hypothetical protein [Nitrospirota bacterium]MBI3593560.1 hypothetical protein [Nitrospirota bacterium]